MPFFGNAKAKGSGEGYEAIQGKFAKHFERTFANEDPRALRIFERGGANGYYTCHGRDALCVARGLFNTTAVVKYWHAGAGQPKLPTVNLNKDAYASVCRMVLVEGTAYALPDANASAATEGTKKSILQVYSQNDSPSWRLVKQGSPSKLDAFEEELCSEGGAYGLSGSAEGGGLALDAAQPVVMSVVIQDKNRKEYDASLGTTNAGQRDHVVGVAFCNPQGEGATHTISACEFLDDEHLCTLESLTVQCGAKECSLLILQAKEAQAAGGDEGGRNQQSRKKILDVFDRCGVLVSEREKDTHEASALERDLGRLSRGGTVEHCREVLDRKVASRAISGLLAFTELVADKRNYDKWEVRVHENGKHMRLDAAAIKALNVTANTAHQSAASRGVITSLSALLSRGRTAMGKRLARTWLKQPLLDKAMIEERLSVVEVFASDIFLRESMRDQYLRGVPDIDRLVRKLEKGTITLMDLCMLYRCSSRLGLITDCLSQYDGPHAQVVESKYIRPLSECHDRDHLVKFEELLEAAIDLDRVPEEYLISPQYSEDLLALFEEKVDTEKTIDEEAEAIAQDLGLILDKTVKLEWHKHNNTRTRCMRITSKEEKAVRKRLQANYTILETRKDGTKFTNQRLRSLASQQRETTAQYDEMQRDLVVAVVNVARSFSGVWQKVSAILGEVDCLCGFADLAHSAPRPYVKPTILASESNLISLRGSRHPLVEAQDAFGDKEDGGFGFADGSGDFIPNDCVLAKGSTWFQVITGPNMGGKSTYIRQVGVIVLMAQVGCFVPCEEAQISIRDAIYARVGAGDCQMRGVSTFMAEMLETSSILKGATERSLVIIDELGRGTSTNDGFGLAWSISEYLMEDIGCASLFATHFHELTKLQGKVGVMNRHVETDLDPKSGKLTMLYKVRDGPCNKSFGIAVAEKVMFPPEVIKEAKEYEAGLSKRIKLTAPTTSAAN